MVGNREAQCTGSGNFIPPTPHSTFFADNLLLAVGSPITFVADAVKSVDAIFTLSMDTEI